MKKITASSSLAFLLFLGFINLETQIHDFDSLYEHSKSSKKYPKSMLDTMDIFNNDMVLNVTIESDFKNLVKQKYKDEYQPAIFRFQLNDAIADTRNIKIKPRGNMRKGSCFFPPLSSTFKKMKW